MTLLLTPTETRVLGSLIEKDITTPDYYPLSLNALVNACNQKNNRDPVMNLDEQTVRDALSTLQEERLAGPASGADSRVPKYEHRLQEVFNFDRREVAIVLRSRVLRLEQKDHLGTAVRNAFGGPLDQLVVGQANPLVAAAEPCVAVRRLAEDVEPPEAGGGLADPRLMGFP